MTRAAFVILVTVTSGCTATSQKADEPVQPERKPAGSKRVPRRLSIFGGPVVDAGVTAASEAKASPDAGWSPPLTGIAVCDDYLHKYYVCLRDHVSARQQPGLRKSLDTFSMVWRHLSRTPAGRRNAEQDCIRELAKAQASTKAWNCKW